MRAFVGRLYDEKSPFSVTDANADNVRAVCREFGFSGFDEQLSSFAQSEAGLRREVIGLMERIDEHDIKFAEWAQFLEDFAHRLAMVEAQCEISLGKLPVVAKKIEEVSNACGHQGESLGELSRAVEEARVEKADIDQLRMDVRKLKDLERRICSGAVSYGSTKTSTGKKVNIFEHLRGKCGGNPHLRGIVEISTPDRDLECYRLFEPSGNMKFPIKNEVDAFIQVDFRSVRVCLSKYRLVCPEDACECSFVVEGSDDGSMWMVIDTRDCQKLKNYGNEFKCGQENSLFYRFMRFRQTAKNVDGPELVLSHIELTGRIDDSELEKELATGERKPKPAHVGVLGYLRDQCGGNPHVKGLVRVTSVGTKNGLPQQILDDKHGWNGSSLQFEFLSGGVCLSGYTLRGFGPPAWGGASWSIEASDDGESWDVVDTQTPEEGLVPDTPFCCSRVSNPSDAPRRFIRLRQLVRFGLSDIDFSGRFEAENLDESLKLVAAGEKPSFVGALEYLRGKFPSKENLKGVVRVTASSKSDESQALAGGGQWKGEKEQLSFIQFDFGSNFLRLSSYSLCSYMLRFWVVEVSNDGNTWTTVDERSKKHRPEFSTTFTCAKPAGVFSRFVRLRNVGLDAESCSGLAITQIEFFGDVQEPAGNSH